MRGLLLGVLCGSLWMSSSAWAQRRSTQVERPSRLTYDLSASAGTYNDASYTEITLGVNWFVQDWLNWRNSVFTRQGSGMDSVQGLDSGLRLQTSSRTDDGTFGFDAFGFDAFAGPGVRFASRSNNAVFGEAGLIFKVGGLRIGGGVKALNYVATREDQTGAALPKNDLQYFLILAGSGSL